MNRKTVIILIILILAGILGLLIYNYISSKIPKYKWTESYGYKSDEPYGCKLLYNLLSEETEVVRLNKSLKKQLPLTDRNTNYLFIGNYYNSDSAEVELLMKYVANGNKAFIFTTSYPNQILEKLTEFKMVYDYYDTTQVSIYFTDADTIAYTFHYQSLKDTISNYWHCVDYNYFTDTLEQLSGYHKLSYVEGHVCYYSVKYGKGEIFFHTIPILFTNYNIITDDGYQNAMNCLKYMNKNKIYWDETRQFFSNWDMPDSSPLRYILSQTGFRWAWYIGLSLILIFLIFKSRREQRIIPIINKPQNTTVEFNKAISTLYFQSNDNSIIAEEIMKMFLLHLKTKFNIIVNLSKYENYISDISKRSDLNEEIIRDIFNKHITAIYGDKKDKNPLIDFHRSIEYFYKNSK